MRNIAVIGAGISGLAAAYFLSRQHRVWLFEREARLGGHTHTVTVDSVEGPQRLDTGFLVHNDRTYPGLVRLLRELDVATLDSDMSFAVSCRRTGLEYSSRGARGFFAQPSNLFSSAHLRLLGEILRFNRVAPDVLTEGDGATPRLTLGDFLTQHRFGAEFIDRYLLPMASAIWSASIDAIRAFPAATLVRFFANHGLLAIRNQPTWKVLRGGSDTYVPRLTAPLGDRVDTGARVTGITRHPQHVIVAFADQPTRTFDDVVLACHGDQVLPLLADASVRERDVFGQFATSDNSVWLHHDASVLPRRAAARASWNYVLAEDATVPPTVSYDLNRLQRLTTSEQYCVTLNPRIAIDPDRVIRRLNYRHPLFTTASVAAQARWHEVSGTQRTHFCGAYWGHGFHEDGLQSAVRVAGALGVAW